MNDTTEPNETSSNGAAGNGPAADRRGPPVRVLAQFIKDLSFELPNTDRLTSGPGENPNLQLEVNVNAQHLSGNRFESVIEFTANASDSNGVIYQLEMVYGGLFEVNALPQDALEPFLLVNCPALLFPFMRRLIADITRESGFPPLMLDPIDFGQLYMQRKQQGTVTAS